MSFLSNFNYQIYGDEKNPKLVFLHGLMGFGANWRKVVGAFQDHYNILTYDQRGHGRSFKPEKGYSPEDYSDDLAMILDELSWQKIHLVGHSMGGRNALNFTYRFPHRVISLVIEDIGPNSNPSDVNRYSRLLGSIPTPFESKLKAKEFLLNDFEDPVLGNYFYSNLVEKEDGSVDWRFSKNAILESVTMGRVQNRWHEVEGLKVPTLLVRGENSKELIVETYNQMLQKNAYIQGAIIKGAGHWVHFDKPDEFIRVVDQFLTKRVPKR